MDGQNRGHSPKRKLRAGWNKHGQHNTERLRRARRLLRRQKTG